MSSCKDTDCDSKGIVELVKTPKVKCKQAWLDMKVAKKQRKQVWPVVVDMVKVMKKPAKYSITSPMKLMCEIQLDPTALTQIAEHVEALFFKK
jgi:adenylate kinase